MSNGSRSGIKRRKKKTFDPSDSGCYFFFLCTLERKVPYASDSDSPSDYVASGNQPLVHMSYNRKQKGDREQGLTFNEVEVQRAKH